MVQCVLVSEHARLQAINVDCMRSEPTLCWGVQLPFLFSVSCGILKKSTKTLGVMPKGMSFMW